MLLQALYDYALRHKLTEELPFQNRTVHLLIPLDREGRLRGTGLVALYQPDAKGKQQVGGERLLPRFPGENNGGKAYFLAESWATILGLFKDTGEPLPVAPRTRTDRNPVLAHCHFWQRIEDAHQATRDARLAALLRFRQEHIKERDGFLAGDFPFLGRRPNERTGQEELCARTEAGEWMPLKKANTVSFEVGGEFIFVAETGDPVRDYWARTYHQEASSEGEPRPTLCLVTGQQGAPIARSHKPRILGVPGLASGGYVVSFAQEAPAFSSFGFEMGENAPVSEEAAAAYALALNDLLASENNSFRVGELAFCFWSAEQTQAVQIGRMLNRPDPRRVADFLKDPFAGVDRGLAKKEWFHSVTLTGNAGRVVVRHWLRESLEQAIENFAQWFRDLEIAQLPRTVRENGSGEEGKATSPYSLFRLAAATVRDAKTLKHKGDAIGQLYRAALEGLRPPASLLKPILNEFQSALVRKEPQRPALNPSRFAFIKLILLRNGQKGDFMPTTHLADTEDRPYNLGRLLAVLANLQQSAHGRKRGEPGLEGPGIVERYYAAASAAPASTFGVLWKLHHHHLRKLQQLGTKGRRIAQSFQKELQEIVAKFPPEGLDQVPKFPPILKLDEQGRFALGFYQQQAFTAALRTVRWNLKKAREARKKSDAAAAELFLKQAKTAADQSGISTLIALVTAASQPTVAL